MPSIPIVFLHTDADAFLPPRAHQFSRVRRYRTANFMFSLATDEQVLLRSAAHLAPVADRAWRARAHAAALAPGALAAAAGTVYVGNPTHPLAVAVVGGALAAAAWVGARMLGLAHVRRSVHADDPETLVVTHHRVLRFSPTGWHRRWDEPPLTESPYDVVEIPHEAIADVRALEIPGFSEGGALEIVTFDGERELVLHVPDAAATAARIREVVAAYAERREVARVAAYS